MIEDTTPEIIVHLSLTVITLLGCLVGYVFKTSDHTEKNTLTAITKTLLSSILAAVVVFLAADAFTQNINLRLALAGFASFTGYDLLVSCKDGVVKLLLDKLKGDPK